MQKSFHTIETVARELGGQLSFHKWCSAAKFPTWKQATLFMKECQNRNLNWDNCESKTVYFCVR